MISLDEAIKRAEEIAEENQRVVDTGIVFDDVTIDMLYCDDTEVIEEHLANYQRCADEHKQLAEWLKELKQLREQTRGIPVSERPPENGKEVFIYMDQSPYLATYEDGEWQTDTFTIDPEYEPTTWWELPKPYKAES